jgi:MFS family permease
MSEPEPAGRTVLDCYGRHYYVRETRRDRSGRDAAIWLAWPPMVAVGLLQYGFGALAPSLMTHRGWSFTSTFALLASWAVCQAGVGFPAAYLRERRGVPPRPIMLVAAVLCAAGMVMFGHLPGLAGALLGYSVLSGAGAGLVYGCCSASIAKWHPERARRKVSVITGVFAAGAAPFAAEAMPRVAALNLERLFDIVGVLMFLVIAGFGVFFRDPPPSWWPTSIDPRQWATSHAPGRRANAPVARQHSPAQAMRTTALPMMYLIGIAAGAVSLFNAAFLVVWMIGLGTPSALAATCIALLLALNGVTRVLAIRLSDRLGRTRALKLVLSVQGIGQLLLAIAASTGSPVMLVVAASVAGCGGGAFYPLVASLVRDYFGDHRALEVHAVVYSAKAFAGVLGVGLAALAVLAWGYPKVFLIAGCLSLGAVAGLASLRRPGLPRTLPEITSRRLA